LAGNDLTRNFIVLREIQFHEGDSISINSLNQQLQLARQQVYNTKLFAEVRVIPIKVANNAIDILFIMKERWYIYPIPQFKLLDRNLNEWIQDHDADFGRVIYGLVFTHFNLTGRKDQLRVVLLNGFTQNLSFSYSRPFTNKALTNGFSFGGGFNRNKEFIYKTDSFNKAMNFNNESFSRKNYFANIGYTLRPNILHQHQFNLVFNHIEIADSVRQARYNPYYFNEGGTKASFIDFIYTYQYINTNNVIYPLNGTTAQLRLTKRGLGFTGGQNMLVMEGTYNRYWALAKQWYAGFQANGRLTLPFKQGYLNQRAMGYGENYLRGLELYVIDGVALSWTKFTLRKKLFAINIPVPVKSKYLSGIPLTFFAKTYSDLGYVYNRAPYQAQLNNKFLYTGGFGLDILTQYDFNMRFEYSFNQLGKSGLFIHAYSGF
jgi:hypothetical protein